MPTEIKAKPKISVLHTNPADRVIASFNRLRLHTKPKNDAESDIAGDAFLALWKREPKLKEEPPPERKLNKSLMEWMMEAESWKDAKLSCSGNMAASATAASMLYEGMIGEDAIKEALDKQKKAEDEREKAEMEQKEAEQAAKDGDEQAFDKHLQSAQEHQRVADEIAEEAVAAVEKIKNNPLAQGMVEGVVQEAAKEGESVAAVCRAWGMNPSEIQVGDVDDILELAKGHGDFLTDLANMIGRMQGIASSTIAATRSHYIGMVTEADITKDPLRLMPTERMYFHPGAPPLLRAIKTMQFFCGAGLLGWRPKVEAKNKGAFVAVVDESGSMHGEPIKAAKAIALGIAMALMNDKSVVERGYEIFGFAEDDDPTPSVSYKDGWRAHVEWAKVFLEGGGTDFNFAIDEAIKRLHALKEQGVSGADCLFITDGYARMTSHTVKNWQTVHGETGARMIVVSIGGNRNPQLEGIADLFIQVKNPQDFGKLAEQIVRDVTSNIIRAEGGD